LHRPPLKNKGKLLKTRPPSRYPILAVMATALSWIAACPSRTPLGHPGAAGGVEDGEVGVVMVRPRDRFPVRQQAGDVGKASEVPVSWACGPGPHGCCPLPHSVPRRLGQHLCDAGELVRGEYEPGVCGIQDPGGLGGGEPGAERDERQSGAAHAYRATSSSGPSGSITATRCGHRRPVR